MMQSHIMAGLFQYHSSIKKTPTKEVDRLESIGVLKWEGASEWGSPTFTKEERASPVLN